MAKFQISPVIPTEAETVRFGAGTAANQRFGNAELGKAVKLVGESRYDLCAAGDDIAGFVTSVESASLDGYSIGGFQDDCLTQVTFDGLQATPGTGTIAVGDYVVAGTAAALGTALGTGGPKVCKATNQPGVAVTAASATVTDINTALAAVADAQKHVLFAWRVVSLGSAGTGAVGTTGVIERVTE